MDTTNVAITKAWLKIADDGEDFCASSRFGQYVEYLPNTATPAATLSGHALEMGMAATRFVFPTGGVWVRIDPSSHLATATVVVSK